MSETQSVIKKRIHHLRELMVSKGAKACVVLSADPHLSEYLPEHWQARAWLSGFQGSAGTLVVTPDFAGLWTDSRYWEQAVVDLAGTGIELMRAGQQDVPSPPIGSFSNWLPVIVLQSTATRLALPPIASGCKFCLATPFVCKQTSTCLVMRGQIGLRFPMRRCMRMRQISPVGAAPTSWRRFARK